MRELESGKQSQRVGEGKGEEEVEGRERERENTAGFEDSERGRKPRSWTRQGNEIS